MMENKKSTLSNGIVIALLVLFFPVGLYLMWAKTNWNKVAKIVVSLFFAVGVFAVVFGQNAPKESAPISSISSSSQSNVDANISSQEKIKQEILDAEKYWQSKVLTDLLQLAEAEDLDGTIAALEEVTAQLDKYVDLFMKNSSNLEIDTNLQQACLDMKTGFYGANTAALKPMLSTFKGESTEVVDYDTFISTASDYIASAVKVAKENK